MSQERVLTLLYDKTFPPRQQSQTIIGGGARGLMGTTQGHSKSAKGLGQRDSIKQFTYNGISNLDQFDEHDVQGLEREIEFILRNSQIGGSSMVGRTHTADETKRPNTMNQGAKASGKRNKTAGIGVRKNRRKPKAGDQAGKEINIGLGSLGGVQSYEQNVLGADPNQIFSE